MDPATVAAGVALLAQIATMIEQAVSAKKEEHTDILAKFTAAKAALDSALTGMHASMAADLAADATALAALLANGLAPVSK